MEYSIIERTLIRSVLINGICLFEVYLLTECAYSEFEPQGGERISAELD